MKCYFTYDENGDKHFIPMCWGTIHSNDKDDCVCQESMTTKSFEKTRFNNIIENKNQTIKEMQEEMDHLVNVIDNLRIR